MDVELLRKGLLAVKLKREEEVRGKKARAEKGNDAEGVAEEEDLMMPGGLCLFLSPFTTHRTTRYHFVGSALGIRPGNPWELVVHGLYPFYYGGP